MTTNPESLGDSARFARAPRPVRTASDLTPVLDAVTVLEETAAQWAKHATALADVVAPPVTIANAANTLADAYREAAHAVRAAVEEVRLSE